MKTIKIQKVRFIKNDAKGNAINLVILDLANGKPSIIRGAKSFLQDLDNSFLVDGIDNIRHPQVRAAMRDLARGTVTGEIKHVVAGDMWKVTADSSVIKDPTHPKYGTVKVGQELPYEKDATIVDGFLDLLPTEVSLARSANAFAIASATVGLDDAFDAPTDTPAESFADAFNTEDIPSNILQEATSTPTKK